MHSARPPTIPARINAHSTSVVVTSWGTPVAWATSAPSATVTVSIAIFTGHGSRMRNATSPARASSPSAIMPLCSPRYGVISARVRRTGLVGRWVGFVPWGVAGRFAFGVAPLRRKGLTVGPPQRG